MPKLTRKPLIAAVSLALGLGIAASVQAGPVSFDTHDSDGVLTIGGFDWSPTSFVAKGANDAIALFASTPGSPGSACPVGGCVFNTMTQVNLGSFLDANGDSLGGAGGLNLRYQITMIARYQEVVTSVNLTTNTVELQKTPGVPINLEIYYNKIGAPPAATVPPADNTKANQLTGFGFNDGTLILRATSITAGSAVFDIDSSIAPTDLDKHLTGSPAGNQYPNQFSMTGSGSDVAFIVGGIATDLSYFLTGVSLLGLDFNNVSNGVPFFTVDPMDCFTEVFNPGRVIGGTYASYACDNTHITGTYADNAGTALAGGYVPITGPVNALAVPGFANPDFVGQTDFNSNLASDVPEPGSLALLGLGLGLLGFGVARRRHPTA